MLPRTTKMADDFGWGRERFVTEGRTLASLHRATAIVHVFDYLEANGTAYIVMELLSGETLEERIAAHGKLSPEEVDRILWPLLDGLEQVHNAGFLHRDIKPANILLDAAGNPTLIDFGASRAAMAGRSTALTAIFTPGYAAAEQMTSAKQGPWTDIYGLSATLYHAITGRTPPSAFDRMLNDTYEPLVAAQAGRASRRACWPASMRAWPCVAQRPAAEHRRLAADPGHDRGAGGRCHGRHRQGGAGKRGTSRPCRRLPAPGAPSGRTGLWIGARGRACSPCWAAAATTPSLRGPDPETVKAQHAAEEAEARRLKAEQEAAKLRAENEQRQKAEAERLKAEEIAAARQRQENAEAAAKKQFEEETRRKIETEIAAQKKAEEEAKRKADEEAEARRKAVEDARKAVEFVAGPFDHFGKTLMMIGLKDRPDEVRLQGVDIVNDPALHKVARQGAGRPAARPALPADRPADRRHAALSLPDHAAQRQAAARPNSRIPTASTSLWRW